MRQRAMIAMAIANDPVLLIADEPTTALDVTIQAQVMQVLADVRRRTGAAMVLITHDLGLVAETARRVAVMYGGRIAETSSIDGLFNDTKHPYAAGLLASLPSVTSQREVLYSIPGSVPDLRRRPSGCAFHPRCGLSAGREVCRTSVPELMPVATEHLSACHFAGETGAWAAQNADALPAVQAAPATPKAGAATLVLDRVRREFSIRRAEGVGPRQARCRQRCVAGDPRREKRSAWSESQDAASRPLAASSSACTRRPRARSCSKAAISRRCRPASFAPCGASCRSCSRTPMRRSIRG